MINKPINFNNESSSCIEFCKKTVKVTIKGTLNFDKPLPPPYYRDVWDYKHANTESIQKSYFNV